MFIRNLGIGAVLGLLLAGIFIWFFARPTEGTHSTFKEQAAALNFGNRFESFPAVGPTRWLRFDQMRNNYRVFGRVSSLQAYLDWRFPNEASIKVGDINLDTQKEPVIVGKLGDGYFIDEFLESGRGFRFRVLETGEFVVETWSQSREQYNKGTFYFLRMRQ